MPKNSSMTLYTCKCDRKVVKKGGFLDNETPITGTFRLKDDCSMARPVIQLARSTVQNKSIQLSKCNYAYVELFQRYYFIDDIIFQNDGLMELHLTVDVLFTYVDKILESQQEVVRSQSVNTPQYVDNERPLFFERELDASASEVFGQVPENQGQGTVNYYLTVAGGA